MDKEENKGKIKNFDKANQEQAEAIQAMHPIGLPSEIKNPFKSKCMEQITIFLRNNEVILSGRRHCADIDLVNGDTSACQVIEDDNIASLFKRIQCFIDSLEQ